MIELVWSPAVVRRMSENAADVAGKAPETEGAVTYDVYYISSSEQAKRPRAVVSTPCGLIALQNADGIQGIGPYSSSDTSAVISGLVEGETYTFNIVARCDADCVKSATGESFTGELVGDYAVASFELDGTDRDPEGLGPTVTALAVIIGAVGLLLCVYVMRARRQERQMQYQMSSISGVGASFSRMAQGRSGVSFAPLSQDEDEEPAGNEGSYAPPTLDVGDVGVGSPAGGSLAERIAARLKEQQQV